MGSIEELHRFNQGVIDDFRQHDGAIPAGRPLADKQLLLLTITDARSCNQRTVPLLYASDQTTLVVAATAGGRDHDPDWANSLRINPIVTIEMPGQRFRATAAELSGAHRSAAYRLATGQLKRLAELQATTDRPFPLFRLVAIAAGPGDARMTPRDGSRPKDSTTSEVPHDDGRS